ncbi:MAG: hypothetical protein NOF05_21600 [Candidatus Accumulibacter phosphatis]|nr:hypothetical protein [Candidatus Accumulibacter phosphatis]
MAFALVLDGKGGARSLAVDELTAWRPEEGFLWVHLRAEDPGVPALLTREFGLEHSSCDALLDETGHPRLIPRDSGTLLVLRTLPALPVYRVKPGLGLCLEAQRAVSISLEESPVIARLQERLKASEGPSLPGDFPAALLHLLAVTYRERLKGMLDQVDLIQDRIYDEQSKVLQTRLSLLRRHAGCLGGLLDDSLRLVDDLLNQDLSWLAGKPHKGIREQRERLHRLLGEMRDLREHLHSLQDEMNGLLDHHLSQRIYQLTVITGVFFPLVFITGLLGVNVGGIPGSNEPDAFWILCLLLTVLGLLGGWLLRRQHWL